MILRRSGRRMKGSGVQDAPVRFFPAIPQERRERKGGGGRSAKRAFPSPSVSSVI